MALLTHTQFVRTEAKTYIQVSWSPWSVLFVATD